MKKIKYLILVLLIPSLVKADPVQTVDAVWASATVAFGSLTTSYASALTNTPTSTNPAKRYRHCIFTNSTNVSISWDDSTTAILAEQIPGTMMALDFATNGRDVRTTVRVKYLGGSAPTIGSASVNCMY